MSKTIYAVLIGINGYSEKPLSGCVNDVIDMKEFLEGLVANNDSIQQVETKLLLAPDKEDDFNLDGMAIEAAGIQAQHYQAPTRENILQSFQHFNKAIKGDICIFYYSGHGSKQASPEVFWHMKSKKQVETLVAVDSRTQDGRDIIDKELGYQVWTTFKDKENVHFLAIMDCCHSADNFRNLMEVTQREENPNPNNTPLKDYFGFEANGNSFYQFRKQGQEIHLSYPDYFHLAGADETEAAKELMLKGKSRGVFTFCLLKTLRNGGLQYSYKELMERVTLAVQNRIDAQTPQLAVYGKSLGGQQFFSTSLNAPNRAYPVFYREGQKQWYMKAGQMHGIPDSPIGTTTIKIAPQKINQLDEALSWMAKVISSQAATALLEIDGNPSLQEDLVGIIQTLAAPSISIFISKEVPSNIASELESFINETPFVEKAEEVSQASHLVRYIEGQLILTKPDSAIPLFLRTNILGLFTTGITKVARWWSVKELDNCNTSILREDIDVEAAIIENKAVTFDNAEHIQQDRVLANPSSISLKCLPASQRGDSAQPGLRVKIKSKKDYYVSALYLSSKYGITSVLKNAKITKEGVGESFRYRDGQEEYTTLLLGIDPIYFQLGIYEITDFIKVFIATTPFDVSKYEQEDLALDPSLILRSSEKSRTTNHPYISCT